jgi:hypothetical protein
MREKLIQMMVWDFLRNKITDGDDDPASSRNIVSKGDPNFPQCMGS